jgi:hypothetical protein
MAFWSTPATSTGERAIAPFRAPKPVADMQMMPYPEIHHPRKATTTDGGGAYDVRRSIDQDG